MDERDRNTIDTELTRRAFELASRARGLVSPNPLVGCVILDKHGQIAGEGTYTFDGVVHAEAIALAEAGPRSHGGTAYVSLEPHDHESKTEPCTEALIRAGIRRVVCPIEDPNPLVSGRGFSRLRRAGVEVVTGLLAEEALRLNEQFICWHEKKRPFVHLKLAMSIDGRISLGRSVSTALSGPSAIERVHELRHRHDAILVGGGTAAADDPMLTDRSGKPRRRPLTRVILDNRLRTGATSNLAATSRQIPTLIFSAKADPNSAATLSKAGIEMVDGIDARDLDSVLQNLRGRDIQSILVEGGSAIAGSFVDARLVDKVTLILAPLIVGGDKAPVAIEGIGAESLAGTLKIRDVTVRRLGEDIELEGYPVTSTETDAS